MLSSPDRIDIAEAVRALGRPRILLSGFSPRHVGIAQTLEVFERHRIPARYVADLSDEQARSFYPDVVIVYAARARVIHQAAQALRTMKCRRGLWSCDLRPPSEAAVGIGAFDGIFLPWERRFQDPRYSLGDCDVSAWQHRLKAKCWYMPQATELREIETSPDHAHRVVFIGDRDLPCHRGRRQVCDSLGAQVFNARRKSGRAHITNLAPFIYASSDFSLSMSPPAVGYTSNRTYNVLGWGGLLLLQHYPDCELQFLSGEHALIFKNIRQAQRLIHRFSVDAERAQAIRLAGWQLCARKHTYTHRILNIAANLLGKSKEFWGYR